MRTWRGALLFVLICQLAGVLGVLTTETGTSAWYQQLVRPSFEPPGWLFGPVWTLLYTLMGIAAWRVWRLGAERPGVRRALTLFALQLLLNAAWYPIFFGMHAVAAALGVLVALWAVLVATMLAFRPLDAAAARLLVPCFAWVSFAAVLNAAILSQNPAS